ncbi:MAG TPA: polymer-forming cytoskeletal protein [Candidatus Binatia bacterium]|nr:polymer-forming cytoskeletal protein [Candidatus Binatia bacterium]
MTWFDRGPGGKKESQSDTKPEMVEPATDAASADGAPSPRSEQAATARGLVGYLYKGSRVTGQLTFQGSARIEGSVDGEIQCNGTLTIGERAEVRAKISGDVVIIRGKVEGNVVAKEKVELVAPARLFGDIDTPRLVITEGVVFDGDCSMGAATQKGGLAKSQNINADKAAAGKTVKLPVDFEK